MCVYLSVNPLGNWWNTGWIDSVNLGILKYWIPIQYNCWWLVVACGVLKVLKGLKGNKLLKVTPLVLYRTP